MDLLAHISPESILNLLSSAAQSQVAQYGATFSLAAWIHSGRVKKELGGIKDALMALLEKESRRIDQIDGRVKELELIKKQP